MKLEGIYTPLVTSFTDAFELRQANVDMVRFTGSTDTGQRFFTRLGREAKAGNIV